MTTRSWILSKFVTIYPLHTSGEFQVFLSYSCQHLNSELSKILSRFLQYLIGTQHDMKWTYVLSHIQGDNPQICGWLFGKCVHFEWLVTPCGRGDSLDLGGQSEASIRAWWPMRGRASGLCSVYLCDDLETESLGPGITVSLSPGPGLSQSANQKWLRRGSADYYHLLYHTMIQVRVLTVCWVRFMTFDILALHPKFPTSPVWQIYPGPRDAYLEELCVVVLRILQIDNIHLAARLLAWPELQRLEPATPETRQTGGELGK